MKFFLLGQVNSICAVFLLAMLAGGNRPADQSSQQAASESEHALLETGLKAIDILAPIPLGGTAHLVGVPGTGSTLMALELAYRFSRFEPKQRVVVVVDNYLAKRDNGEFVTEFNSVFGPESVNPRLVVLSTEVNPSPESLLGEQLQLERLESGVIIVTVSDIERFFTRVASAVDGLRGKVGKPVTSISVTQEVTFPDVDSKIVLSRFMAAFGFYPAVDPRHSEAREEARLSARHRKVIQQLRPILLKLLQGYPDIIGPERRAFEEARENKLAFRLQRFLTQPQFTAEKFTGLKAGFVTREQSLAAFERLLNGEFSELPATSFTFVNSLEDALKKSEGLKAKASVK